MSGGVGSAVVLAIAVDALGPEHVTAVRLPSRYKSELSNALAEEQCSALGVRLLTLPIEAPFQGYLDALEEEFADQPPDEAEQNLQAACADPC